MDSFTGFILSFLLMSIMIAILLAIILALVSIGVLDEQSSTILVCFAYFMLKSGMAFKQ